MNKILMFSSICILGLSTQAAWADCTTNGGSANLGTVSSLNIASLGSTTITGGLSCTGSLNLASTQYVKYKAVSIPTALTHSNGVDKAQITVKDNEQHIVSSGLERDLSKFNLISLFGGPNNSIPFTISVNETTNLRPGTYTGNIQIDWYYYIGAFGIAGIHLWSYKSPGVVYVWLLGIQNWGSGSRSTIPITLTVEKDCKINAQNINFGTAPLVSKFNPVTGSIKITCSAQTPYTVGVSNGQNYSQTRRMKNQSSNQYLPYEIYKNTSTNRWGSAGTERWSSANASQNPNIYDGSVSQGYSYTAKIIDNGSNASIAGTYKDNLILEVAF